MPDSWWDGASADLETYARVFCTGIQYAGGLWWLQHSKPLCGSSHAGGTWSWQAQVGRSHGPLCYELDPAFVRTLQALLQQGLALPRNEELLHRSWRGEGPHSRPKDAPRAKEQVGSSPKEVSCGQQLWSVCTPQPVQSSLLTQTVAGQLRKRKNPVLALPGFVQLPGEILPYPINISVRPQFMTFWVLFPGWP